MFYHVKNKINKYKNKKKTELWFLYYANHLWIMLYIQTFVRGLTERTWCWLDWLGIIIYTYYVPRDVTPKTNALCVSSLWHGTKFTGSIHIVQFSDWQWIKKNIPTWSIIRACEQIARITSKSCLIDTTCMAFQCDTFLILTRTERWQTLIMLSPKCFASGSNLNTDQTAPAVIC